MIAPAGLCLAGALATALLLLVGARALGWRRRLVGLLVRPWLLAIWILLTIGLGSAGAGGFAEQGLLIWTLLAAWLVVSVQIHVVDRIWTRQTHVARRWGGMLAHSGIALAAGGLILSSVFTSSTKRMMAPGDTVSFNGWAIQLHEVWPAAGGDWTGVTAEVRASDGRGVLVLEPQWRTYFDRRGRPVAQPASVTSTHGRLAAGVGQRADGPDWPITLTWTPLLVLIPLGVLLAAFGGAVAMVGPPIDRWRRLRRARLATAWWA